MDGDSDDRYRAPALDKGLDILELLAAMADGLSQAEIAKALERSPNEIYRMLDRLVRRDYVRRTQEGRFEITLKLFELAHARPPLHRLVSQATPALRHFALKAEQAVQMVVRERNILVVVAQFDSPDYWNLSVRVGSRIGLVNTGSGHVFLAFASPEERVLMLGDQDLGRPEKMPKDLEARLDGVCAQGHELMPSAQVYGVTNLSVPIFGPLGTVIAVLTCPYTQRLDKLDAPDMPTALKLLQRAAKEISRRAPQKYLTNGRSPHAHSRYASAADLAGHQPTESMPKGRSPRTPRTPTGYGDALSEQQEPMDENMAHVSADRIAVSTWSLHRLLGTTYPHDLTTTAIGPMQETYGEGEESLLGLPSMLANHGYHRLEILSFHLRSRDPIYLGELRDQLRIANVRLQTLLIDAGDISHPEYGARDTAWVASWIEVANELGAENARIIAGKQKPTRDALDRSVKALTTLAGGNAGSSVRLVTENWFDLLAEPAHVHYLLDKLEGRIGLLGDFGNWSGAAKYSDLKSIFGRAELCHAKASFIDGDLDEADYGQCITLAEEAGYEGPYTLIFDSKIPGEWHGLATERDFITTRDV